MEGEARMGGLYLPGGLPPPDPQVCLLRRHGAIKKKRFQISLSPTTAARKAGPLGDLRRGRREELKPSTSTGRNIDRLAAKGLRVRMSRCAARATVHDQCHSIGY